MSSSGFGLRRVRCEDDVTRRARRSLSQEVWAGSREHTVKVHDSLALWAVSDYCADSVMNQNVYMSAVTLSQDIYGGFRVHSLSVYRACRGYLLHAQARHSFNWSCEREGSGAAAAGEGRDRLSQHPNDVMS